MAGPYVRAVIVLPLLGRILLGFVYCVVGFNVVTFLIAFVRRPPRRVVTAFIKELLATLVLVPAWPLFALLGERWQHVDLGAPPAGAHRTPVILLHGYLMNRTNWLWFGPQLARRGLGPVYGLSYFSLAPVEKSAERLAAFIEKVARREGVEQVDVVAHSMGGLVARWFIEKSGGGARVRKLITIATPHHGTALASLALGRARRDIHPGSPLFSSLGQAPHDANYTSIWSRCDNMVLPPESAQLTPIAPESGEAEVEDMANNVYDDVVFDDLGHLSLLLSPRVVEAVADRLSA